MSSTSSPFLYRKQDIPRKREIGDLLYIEHKANGSTYTTVFISIDEDMFALQKYRYFFRISFSFSSYVSRFFLLIFFHRHFQLPEVVIFLKTRTLKKNSLCFCRALHFVSFHNVGAGLLRRCKSNTFQKSDCSADIVSS